MSFLHVAALALLVLVVAPLVAHLLQRKRSDVLDFPPARLVPPSPPLARRRQTVDDRLLYIVRTLSVVGLALLGAVPFIRCSSLAFGRRGGASVALAIVLDDSLSMRAQSGTTTRWARAHGAAEDLLSGAREGDAVAIVLAGMPPRIALASTTDLGAARTTLRALKPSDRATDLVSAVDLARTLVENLPQSDRRVILLSDLADGQPQGRPLSGTEQVPLWIPLDDLVGPAQDCAVIRADRQRARVTVRVACSEPGAAAGRSIEIRTGDRTLASAPVTANANASELTLDLPDRTGDITAALSGSDAIAADDKAPVLDTSGKMAIAVVADPASNRLVTGGPPAIEQALSALELDAQLKPLPLVPDHADELSAYANIAIEDPAGFTPETRRSLAAWLEHGGVALIALGPHAAYVPLGASFEPLLTGPVTWGASPTAGLDDSAGAWFGGMAAGLATLAPRGRATLDASSLAPPARIVARWKDGAPWLVERPIGRGLVMAMTLPTSPDVSDSRAPPRIPRAPRHLRRGRARSNGRPSNGGRPDLALRWRSRASCHGARRPPRRRLSRGGTQGGRSRSARRLPHRRRRHEPRPSRCPQRARDRLPPPPRISDSALSHTRRGSSPCRRLPLRRSGSSDAPDGRTRDPPLGLPDRPANPNRRASPLATPRWEVGSDVISLGRAFASALAHRSGVARRFPPTVLSRPRNARRTGSRRGGRACHSDE